MCGKAKGVSTCVMCGKAKDGTRAGAAYGLAADVFSLGMTLFAVWAAATTPLEAVIDQVEALHVHGTPPAGFDAAAFEAACPFAPLVLRMVAHAPGARPTAVEAAEEIAGLSGVLDRH